MGGQRPHVGGSPSRPGHAYDHPGRNHRHHAQKHRHRHGFWRSGVWVDTGYYGYVGDCAYEYQMWRRTGSSYWRIRYYDCLY